MSLQRRERKSEEAVTQGQSEALKKRVALK